LDNGLALTFGLVHTIPLELAKALRNDDINLPLIYDNDSCFLPMPATYIVDRDGVIVHAYVNPDFRERLDPEKIVEFLTQQAPR
jgi:hypothetical protein